MDEIIRINNVSKAYKLYPKKSDRLKEAISIKKRKYHSVSYALKDISFSVYKGETIGIIGTNGSGKSTLLKIISGVVEPTDGTVQVKGRVSALLELGAGFNMEYTGLENIDLQGIIMGISLEEMKIRKKQIIEFADIGEYISQPVKSYSSGMFARLAFAVAISVNPEILIVDEALSVGDMYFQSKCFRKFNELRDAGVTILFVSHDINTVRKMCNRVIWIENGRQNDFGDTNLVCNRYFNEQTRRLNEQNKIQAEEHEEENLRISEKEKRTVVISKIEKNADSMYSEEAEILSVQLKTNSGKITKVLVPDETYTIEVISQFNKDLENVIVGFVLGNSKGINYLAENTFLESGEKGMTVKKGLILRSSFTFAMPKIRGGEYEISPAIAIGTQRKHVNLTWIHGACSVNVIRDDYELSEIKVATDVHNEQIEKVIFE